MTRRPSALVVLLGAAWGAVYPLTTLALRDLAPLTLVAARTALSVVVLLPFAIRREVLTEVRAHPIALPTAALLQATIPLMLLTMGQQHVSAGMAGILVGSQPVWASVLSGLAVRSINARELAGVLVGLAGVSLLFAHNLNEGATSTLASTLLLGAGFFYAAGAVYIERSLPDVSPFTTAAAAMTITTVALTPFILTAVPSIPDAVTVGWLIALGVGGTGAALVLFYALIHRLGAVRANLAAYLAPGFAVLYGVAFLHDRVTITILAALVLVTMGSALAAVRRPSTG